ncbi:hypothetical protein, partial [Enterobacter hormaechei]|uniref:hypothetical protein n=1 Tax=Enterobacter hormaechei TaxID=158836 RepID=UPI0023E3EB3E
MDNPIFDMDATFSYDNPLFEVDIDQSFYHIQLSLNAVSLHPSFEDEIIWYADPSGQFKVSSFFI